MSLRLQGKRHLYKTAIWNNPETHGEEYCRLAKHCFKVNTDSYEWEIVMEGRIRTVPETQLHSFCL